MFDINIATLSVIGNQIWAEQHTASHPQSIPLASFYFLFDLMKLCNFFRFSQGTGQTTRYLIRYTTSQQIMLGNVSI